jgi:iron complex outermembrane receptor protein
VGLTALACAGASPAAAQSSGPTATPASAPAGPDEGIADIVVTAQRRPERLQNVPVSVTALTSDALVARGLNDQTQITLAVPSLQLGKENNFTVRGIGTLAFAGTIDTSVAQSLDDINIGRPLAAPPLFYDVAQVEVLNGPQGLLFGKNASAGLVNIRTTQPKIGALGASFGLEADSRPRPGSDGSGVIARSALNLPVSDDAALRIASVYSFQDALTRHVGGRAPYEDNLHQYGVRAKYDYLPSVGLYLRVQGDYNESHGISGFYDGTFRGIAAGSVNTGPLAADGVIPGDRNLLAAADAQAYRDLKNGGAQATIGYQFANGINISNIAGWRFYDIDQQIDGDTTGQNAANLNHNVTHYDQFSNELRVALPEGDRLTGQAGLFYFHSKIDTFLEIGGDNFFPPFLLPQFPFCVGAAVKAGPPPACNVSNDFFLGIDKTIVQKTDSYAAFGQLTYALTDKLHLIGGARVTRDEIAIDLRQNQLRNYFAPFASRNSYDQAFKNTDFSYRVGAQYNFAPAIMAYATYARGYKGPGFNDVGITANSDLAILPETSKSFEAGLKSTFFNRRLVFNISAFHTKFSNYQTQSFDPVVRTFIVANGASLTSQGIEINTTARLLRGLTLNGAATFLDSKFDNFAGAQCYPGQPTPSCAATGSFNAGGLQSPSAPKFTSTIDATYETPIAEGISGFISGNWYHRSSINFLVNRAPGAQVDPIDIFGGNLGVRGDHWRAALFCKNCSNKIYPNYVDLESGDSIGGLASYVQTLGYNSVRTIGLQFGFDF